MEIIKQDILDIHKGVIVHGCNCSGGFASGVAGQIRQRIPKVYERYIDLMGNATITNPYDQWLGYIQVVEITPELYIINGFTQIYYGRNKGTKYAHPKAIDNVMYKAACFAIGQGLDLYAPLIGCGLGGLSWEEEVKGIYCEIQLLLNDNQRKLVVCNV